MKPRSYSSTYFAITTILLLTMLQMVNTYQHAYASAAGLKVIVRATTDSDNPDITPVIMVVRDSQTFGIAESLLISDDGSVATSEVVFQFFEGAIENGKSFLHVPYFWKPTGK